jgi:dihydroorotase
MNKVLIKNAKIVNEGWFFEGDVLIENDLIVEISEASAKSSECNHWCRRNYLIPDAIDDRVHFRAGLTYKGDIESESKAAVTGGITSIKP